MLHAVPAASATAAKTTEGDLSKGSEEFEKLNNAILAGSRIGTAWIKLADDWNLNVFKKRAELSVLASVWKAKLNEYWEKYTLLWIADKGPVGLPNPFSIAPEGLSKDRADIYMGQVAQIESKNKEQQEAAERSKAAAVAAAVSAEKSSTRVKTVLFIGLTSVAGWWLYRRQQGLPFLP